MQTFARDRVGSIAQQATYSEFVVRQWSVRTDAAPAQPATHDARETQVPAATSPRFSNALLMLGATAAGLLLSPIGRQNLAPRTAPLMAVAGTAAPAPAVSQTVEKRPPAQMVSRPVWRVQHEQRAEQVLRPVWVTLEREEPYTVSRPVVETAVHYEKVQVNRPVTTYREQVVDRGSWVTEQAAVPGKPAMRIKWVSGGWTTDPLTGLSYWRPGMLLPVQVPGAPTTTERRVWKPNLVKVHVPETKLVAETQSKPTYVQTVRYIEEHRVRKVPVRVCQFVPQQVVRSVPVVTCQMVQEVEKPQAVESAPAGVPAPAGAPARPSPAVAPVIQAPANGVPDQEPEPDEPLNPSRVAANQPQLAI